MSTQERKPTTLAERARIQQLKGSITLLARNMEHTLHQAFERSGCSCAPDREALERVDEEMNQLKAAVNTTPAYLALEAQRTCLANRIRETDKGEHPKLNELSQVAIPFFRLWLFENMMDGTAQSWPHVLDLPRKELAAAYVTAWYAGWRPGTHSSEK